MKKTILLIFAYATMLLAGACSEHVLDRGPLTTFTDDTYWTDESRIRLYANYMYSRDSESYVMFHGYGRSWTGYCCQRYYTLSDDVAQIGSQSGFATSKNSASTSRFPGAQWSGRGWNFTMVREANILINRVRHKAKGIISDEACNHWIGVGRLFRAMEYEDMVRMYGDMPFINDAYYDTDYDQIYRPRDPRATVTDSIYEDLKFAIDNIREDDGEAGTTVNKFVAAAYASRIMMWEGTYQWYHNGNTALAKKYLDFAVEAANVVMNSGRYSIDVDFHTLFGSDNLAGVKECIIYRHYDAGQSIRHSTASYNNYREGVTGSANLSLLKSFICNDGLTYQTSSSFAGIALGSDGEKFTLKNLIKTRDPRFEASFYREYVTNILRSSTLIYCNKFIDRLGTEPAHTYEAKYSSATNTNDCPVMRLGEVLLNYIEAKAVCAQHCGGTAVSQSDIDRTINALRDRPIDAEAVARGVKKTAHLTLGSLPNDPERDSDVPELIWEIRRERRMELIFEEPSRLWDLRRWKKLKEYLTTNSNFPDIMCGPWVDMQADIPAFLVSGQIGKIGVRKLDGTIVKYDGTNATNMVGFYLCQNGSIRNQEPEDRHYLAPIPESQINLYKEHTDANGNKYVLTQNPGWE